MMRALVAAKLAQLQEEQAQGQAHLAQLDAQRTRLALALERLDASIVTLQELAQEEQQLAPRTVDGSTVSEGMPCIA